MGYNRCLDALGALISGVAQVEIGILAALTGGLVLL